VSQLRAGLYDEIENGLAHKVGDADLRNSSSPIPMEVEKPTIEEFLGQLKSNGGLEESRHAPKMQQLKMDYLRMHMMKDRTQ
jgi:hypothetical protein